jgi:hypothetical protein
LLVQAMRAGDEPGAGHLDVVNQRRIERRVGAEPADKLHQFEVSGAGVVLARVGKEIIEDAAGGSPPGMRPPAFRLPWRPANPSLAAFQLSPVARFSAAGASGRATAAG